MNADYLMIKLAHEGLMKIGAANFYKTAAPAKKVKQLAPPGFFSRLTGGSSRYAKKKNKLDIEGVERQVANLRKKQQKLEDSGGLLSGVRSRRVGRKAEQAEGKIPQIRSKLDLDIAEARKIDSGTRANTVLGGGAVAGGGYYLNKKRQGGGAATVADPYAGYSNYGY